MKRKSIILVGAGPMAVEYAKVLQRLKKDFIVVSRGQTSADQFMKVTGVTPITGGIEKFFTENNFSIREAIIAVSEDQLGIVALQLIEMGIKSILLEKPGGSNFLNIKSVQKAAKISKAKVFVAYNRRFYASVEKAQEIIRQDGGVLSIHFEFTELADRITPLIKAPSVKENWFLHNSSHVTDLAFFLGGKPKTLSAYIKGRLPWHPKASIFSGAGITIKNALFSYHANWEAPGRWGVEVLTKNNRLILKPLEKLHVQKKGSFNILEIKIDDRLDKEFKPGLYKQVKAFIAHSDNLCTIEEQVNNLNYYKKILEGRRVKL